MRIAITGGTGFIGRNLAKLLLVDGHTVVLISRGVDWRDDSVRPSSRAIFAPIGIDDTDKLAQAFAGCDGVAHCAGINRQIGRQTYQRVHVEGTRNVITAARAASVKKIAQMSFLRARPDCGSGYHETKFAAEELVRNSGLDYTVLKAGIIYGRGDHMLDHLSHAFHTLPIFGLVGFKDQPVRPTAVADLAQIIRASLIDGRLSRQTVAVTGPEQLRLSQAVKRVAAACGRNPLTFPMPVWFHYTLGWLAERLMKIPLISTAQVQMLTEGIVDPLPPCDFVPEDLAPATPFSELQIRAGLPEPKGFGLGDLQCCGWGKVS